MEPSAERRDLLRHQTSNVSPDACTRAYSRILFSPLLLYQTKRFHIHRSAVGKTELYYGSETNEIDKAEWTRTG